MRNSSKKTELSKETKAVLKTALVELYAINPISKITVNQLCEKAGVSRGSFYYHYANVFDLLEDIENDVINEINLCVQRDTLFEGIMSRYTDEKSDAVTEYLSLLNYLELNRRTIAILYLGSDSSFFRDKLIQMTLNNLNTAFSFLPLGNDTHRKYIPVYMASGIVSTYMKWLIDGMHEPKELVAEVIIDTAGRIFALL